VIGSDPRRGGRAPDGSTIIVFLSRGQGDPCKVPDVMGETGGTAASILNEAGLESSTREVSSGQPIGVVVRQSKAGGVEVECGSTVVLSVSKGTGSPTPPSDPGGGTGG